jgi:hypothetical protein
MLATAPTAISVSERRGQCNTRRPENAQSRARCASRTAVFTDKRLPMGARVLYGLLDDYAGMRAECWPHQSTAGERIGRSARSVKRYISLLVAYGHLSIRRGQSGNRYRLAWATVPENNAPPQNVPCEVPAQPPEYKEPDQEPTVSNTNIFDASDSESLEFDFDDAVRLYQWASQTP